MASTRISNPFAGKSYPTEPAPLRPGEIAEFSARRRSANRRLSEAQAKRERGGQKVRSEFDRFRKSLDRQADERRRDSRESTAARGMALQPRGLGRELRKVRDWHAGQFADAKHSKAERLAALEESVRQARVQRDEELALVRAGEGRAKGDIERLFRPVQ